MREMWYVVDGRGNMINEGEGFAERIDAIYDFKNKYTKEEATEEELILCKIEEDENYYYGVLEELTVEEIF